MRTATLFVFSVLTLATLQADPPKQEAPKWTQAIDAITNRAEYKHAHWGLLVVDMESGKPILEQNADQLFVPASTTKLFSGAAALDALGGEHRFKTEVYQIEDDLVLVAGGDLTLGGRTDKDGKIAFKNSDHTYANRGNSELTEPDPLGGLNNLATQIKAAGIAKVREVVIDDRLFDPAESTGSGPVRVTPISVNDNLIDFTITPGKEGAAASVVHRPESSLLRIDAQVDTVAADAKTEINITTTGANRFVVRGQIAAGHKPILRVAEVDDPAAFARGLFIEALAREGIKVKATPLSGNPTNLLPRPIVFGVNNPCATLTSPPFSEHLKLILKVSHNLHASTLPLLLAAQNGRKTLKDGLRLQHDRLKKLGVAVDTISFGGGAGGARADLTTPRATVQLLLAMAKHKEFAVFEAALPVMGVDGTLATVVGENSPAKGKVRAKTGTFVVDNLMNDRVVLTSKALAGYLTTASGRKLAFAFFVNNTHLDSTAETVREGKALGQLCEVLMEVK